jgi:hypothetical protein
MPFEDPEKKKAYKCMWATAKRAKSPESHREANANIERHIWRHSERRTAN